MISMPSCLLHHCTCTLQFTMHGTFNSQQNQAEFSTRSCIVQQYMAWRNCIQCIILQACIAQKARKKKRFVSDDIETFLPVTAPYLHIKVLLQQVLKHYAIYVQCDAAMYKSILYGKSAYSKYSARLQCIALIASFHCTECTLNSEFCIRRYQSNLSSYSTLHAH